MQLSVHAKTNAVPLWVVSNGEVTIGPVRTELLLRGIRHGRVPLDCQVRPAGSEIWRPLDELREVAALRGQPGSVRDFQQAAAGIARASDEREVLLLLLHGAAAATRATVGLLHAVREPVHLPVTSYEIGGLDESLGQVISPHDATYALATAGQRLLGAPADGVAERLTARRLGDEQLASVVMVPLTPGTELVAMLELGRPDRRFRIDDADALSRLATLAVARLDEIGR